MIRRWDKSKPPTGPFALNRDCPQAQGLVAWYPMDGGAVYDRLGTNHHVETAITRTLDNAGAPATVFNGTTSVLQSAIVPIYAAPLSVGFWFYKNVAADTTNFGISAFGDYTKQSIDGARRFQIDTYNGSLRWLAVGDATGVASKSGIAAKQWHHGLCIEISTASRYAALDGVLGTQDTTAAVPGATPNRFTLGSIFDAGANSGFMSGQLGEVCVWNKSNYGNEKALADPGRRFELWYPLRSRKWISIGAAGPTYTLACAGGTFAYSGGTATLAFNRVLASAGGTFSYSGGDATLTYTPAGTTYTLACAGGTFSYSGGTATLAFNRVLSAASGTFSYAGGAAALGRGWTIPAAAGTFSYSGGAATFLRTYVLAAAGGSFSLGGGDATLTYSGAPIVVPENRGGGKAKRRRRYQLEIDGEVINVASPEEAEAVLADLAQKAQETAKVAIERATKAKRRPVRKVVGDARKALHVPEIATSPDFRDLANQVLGQIKAEYQSALSAIEIAAHIARREREIEEDDEEVLMLL